MVVGHLHPRVGTYLLCGDGAAGGCVMVCDRPVVARVSQSWCVGGIHPVHPAGSKHWSLVGSGEEEAGN